MQIIRNWEELSKVQPSATHSIEIYPCNSCGWVHNLTGKNRGFYLNTHTFYNERNVALANNRLKASGFDIELDWRNE